MSCLGTIIWISLFYLIDPKVVEANVSFVDVNLLFMLGVCCNSAFGTRLWEGYKDLKK